MSLPVTIWNPTNGNGESGAQADTLLLTESGFELATEDGFSLLLETATHESLDSTVWASKASYETEVTPIYRATSGLGENGRTSQKDITTLADKKIITKDGKKLIILKGTYERLAPTIWTMDEGI